MQAPQSPLPPFRVASSGSYAQEMKNINDEDNISLAWITNSGRFENKMKRDNLKNALEDLGLHLPDSQLDDIFNASAVNGDNERYITENGFKQIVNELNENPAGGRKRRKSRRKGKSRKGQKGRKGRKSRKGRR